MTTFKDINDQIQLTQKQIDKLNFSTWIEGLEKIRKILERNVILETDAIKKLQEQEKLEKNTLEILKTMNQESEKMVSSLENELKTTNSLIESKEKTLNKMITLGQVTTPQQILTISLLNQELDDLEEKEKILKNNLQLSIDFANQQKLELQNYEKIVKHLENIKQTEIEITKKGEEFFKNFTTLPKVSTEFWERLKGIEGTLGKISIISKSFLNGMLNMVTISNIIGKMTEVTKELILELDRQGALTSQLTGQNRLYMGEIYDASVANRALGVSLAETGEAFRSLYENLAQFSTLSKSSKSELTLLTSQMKKFGISGETTANIILNLTKALGNTEKEAINVQKTLFFVASNLGLGIQRTIKEFQSSLSQLSVYGNKSIEIFKNLASVSKLTGIAVSELNSVFGQQLNTFEGSANMAGKLNSILGKDLLNSVDLLYQSEDERLKTVLKSLQADGRNIQNMSKYERLTIATAIGFKDMDKFMRLASMSLEELEIQQAKAKLAQADQEQWNAAVKAATTFVDKLKIAWQQIAVAVKPLVIGLTIIVEKFANLLKDLNENVFPGAGTAFLILTAAVVILTKSTIAAFTATSALAVASTGAATGTLAAGAAAATSTGFIASLGTAFMVAATKVWAFMWPILAVVAVVAAVSLAVWGLVKAFKALKKWWVGKKQTKLSTLHMDEYQESVKKTTPVVQEFADKSELLHKVQTKKGSPALWEISSVMAQGTKEFHVQVDKSNSKLEKHNEILRQTSNISKVQNVSTSSDIQRLEYAKNSNIPTTKNISIDVNFLDIEATNRSLKKAIMQVFEEELR